MKQTYLHRDDMLRRLGRMPARKDGETAERWENRKACRANAVAKEYGLDRYSSGASSLQYSEQQVDEIARVRVVKVAA